MKRNMIRVLLCLSGALLFVVGMAVMFQPQMLFAADGAMFDTYPDLMSELRSPGGLLLASGIVIFLGAVRKNLSQLALMLSALVYGTYGVSRLVSMAFDGIPSTSLVVATGVELTVGILSLVFLFGHSRVLSSSTARQV